MTRVLVAGAGVAAVECVLALRELAGEAVEVELLAPAGELVYRPASVTTPFGAEAARRYDLAGLGCVHHHDALAEVSPATHEVITRDGERIAYDQLVVATGAHSREAVTGAVTFRGPLSAGAMEAVLARAAADPELRVAFAAPAGATWPLPLYELALLTAAALRERGVPDPDLTVVTAEERPLAALGAEATDAVLGALDGAGIDVIAGAAARAAVEGALRLHDGRVVGADVAVALPVVEGPRIPGLPHDADGFLEVDEHGRVRGCDDVYAAGDATAFPIKHGSARRRPGRRHRRDDRRPRRRARRPRAVPPRAAGHAADRRRSALHPRRARRLRHRHHRAALVPAGEDRRPLPHAVPRRRLGCAQRSRRGQRWDPSSQRRPAYWPRCW